MAKSREQASCYKTALVQMAGSNDLHIAIHPEPTTAATVDTAYTIPAMPVSTLSQLFIHAPEGNDENIGHDASGNVDGSGSDDSAGQGLGVDDPRCQRCALYGQVCLHSTIGHDKLLPGPCAGCVSNNVDCSFVDTVPAPPNISGLATSQSRQHVFLGFNDPVTRTVFLEFVQDILDMGVITASVKAETVKLFERLSAEAISRVPRLYIDKTGQLVLVES